MSDFKTRLGEEKEELDNRREKLHNFMHSKAFREIDPIQMTLLNIQKQAMDTYSQCLLERIVWLSKESVL